MGRYAEKYTQAQRETVGAAMLDNDPLLQRPLTAKEATQRLNQGKLGVPPPTQPMPTTTAYDCRNKEARRRTGHELSPLAKQALEDPTTIQNQLRQRVLTLHEHQLAELEAQRAKGKPIDPRQYSNVVKNTPIILALFKPPSKNGDAQKRPNSRPVEPEPQNHVARLLQANKTAPTPTLDTDSALRTQDAGHTNAPSSRPALASSDQRS
jgi:hypothetical protein